MNPSAEWFPYSIPKDIQGYELWLDAEEKRQQDEAEELYVLWLAEQAKTVHA